MSQDKGQSPSLEYTGVSVQSVSQFINQDTWKIKSRDGTLILNKDLQKNSQLSWNLAYHKNEKHDFYILILQCADRQTMSQEKDLCGGCPAVSEGRLFVCELEINYLLLILRGGFKTKNWSNFGICPNLRWPPPPSRLRTPLVEKNIFAYLSSTGFETQLVRYGWHPFLFLIPLFIIIKVNKLGLQSHTRVQL